MNGPAQALALYPLTALFERNVGLGPANDTERPAQIESQMPLLLKPRSVNDRVRTLPYDERDTFDWLDLTSSTGVAVFFLRLAVVAATAAVAIFTPDLHVLVDLVGCVFGSFLVLILPNLCELVCVLQRRDYARGPLQLAVSVSIILLAIAASGIGTAEKLQTALLP